MAVTKITGAGLGLPNADGNALGGASNEWSDLYLADGSTIQFGNDQDVTLTHVADTGILLNSTMAIQFNDSSQYINAPSATVLDINATDEIELNATLVDINANVEISGTATTTGVHTFSAVPVFPNDTVETADIQDNAVTLAKMAGGTDGNVISYDASGDPVAIATGSDGQVLTSTGAGSPPAFEDAAAGGAWTLIGTQVASDSADLTQTGLDSTYDTYAIGFSDIIPGTDQQAALFRVGDSSGIDSGGSDYSYHVGSNRASSSSYAAANSSGNGQIYLVDQVGTATGEGLGGMLFITGPGDKTSYPMITGTVMIVDYLTMNRGGAVNATRNAVITLDRVQISFSSGNIASGRMTVWGIAHAQTSYD